MEFFDRKEEVLDVQLTQYGKYLLSVGKLNPVYYAFFDDDIDYDTQYQGDAPKKDNTGIAGPNENQKDTEDRIKETPRIKAIHSVDTVEKSSNQIGQLGQSAELGAQGGVVDFLLKGTMFGDDIALGNGLNLGYDGAADASEAVSLDGNGGGMLGNFGGDGTGFKGGAGFEDGKIVGTLDDPAPISNFLSPTFGDIPYKYPIPKKQNTAGLKIPLGTSDYNSKFYPAFDMNFKKGKIKSAVEFDSNSFGIKKIPQIEVEVIYETTIGDNLEGGGSTKINKIITIKDSNEPAEFNYVDVSNDGTYVKIEEDYISIDLKEIHSLKQKQNFVVEVYEIENPDQENEILHPLKFADEFFSTSYNNFLYDKTNNGSDSGVNFVDHFFKISVDDEIQTPEKTMGIGDQFPANDFDLCEDNNEL